MSGANVSPIGRAQTGWLVQATDYRKLNEPPRPRLQRNGTIYLMARPPLLCQGGDFAFPAGCPRRPCPADDLWVTLKRWCKEGNNALSQLIHTFGVVRSREIVLEFERTTPSTPFILNSSTSGALKLAQLPHLSRPDVVFSITYYFFRN